MNNYVFFWFLSVVFSFILGMYLQKFLFVRFIEKQIRKFEKDVEKNTLFFYVEMLTDDNGQSTFYAYEEKSNKFIVSASNVDELTDSLKGIWTTGYLKCTGVKEISKEPKECTQ